MTIQNPILRKAVKVFIVLHILPILCLMCGIMDGNVFEYYLIGWTINLTFIVLFGLLWLLKWATN